MSAASGWESRDSPRTDFPLECLCIFTVLLGVLCWRITRGRRNLPADGLSLTRPQCDGAAYVGMVPLQPGPSRPGLSAEAMAEGELPPGPISGRFGRRPGVLRSSG